MKIKLLLPLLLLAGCSPMDNAETNQLRLPFFTEQKKEESKPAEIVALQYINFAEKTHRKELKELTGVDPVRTEWCAAFVNAVLEESGIESNKEHAYPLTARAFLDWGQSITKADIQPGDLVIFPRGKEEWQGHVGFYMRSQTINKRLFYYILGGNQDNRVSIRLYPASRVIGIRRHKANL